MVKVTEADRLAAAQLIENYWHGDPSKAGNGMRRLAQSYKDGHAQGVWVTAFATHRIEAAKAERDRLQQKIEALEAEIDRLRGEKVVYKRGFGPADGNNFIEESKP